MVGIPSRGPHKGLQVMLGSLDAILDPLHTFPRAPGAAYLYAPGGGISIAGVSLGERTKSEYCVADVNQAEVVCLDRQDSSEPWFSAVDSLVENPDRGWSCRSPC